MTETGVSTPVFADTTGWTGAGGSANNRWSNISNWTGSVPADVSDVVFAGNTGMTSVVSLLDRDFLLNSLTFNNGTAARAFTITEVGSDNQPHDNLLHIGAGGITNNTALTQTINGVIRFASPSTFTAAMAGGTLSLLGTASNIYNYLELNNYGLTVTGAGNTTIASPITGNGASNTLTKNGTGTLTLAGTGSSFTGNLRINQGTVVAATAQTSINPTTSVLGSTMTAGRTITVGDGANTATLQMAASQIFGTGNSNPQVGIVINKGATLTNSGGQFNILPNLTLNGGTLTGTGGMSANDQMYSFAFGKVTVSGTSSSYITGSGTNSGYHLGGSTTFEVARTSANAGVVDLIFSGNLLDNFATNGPGSLVKTGAGTMTLTGTNTYSGSTTVNQGTLIVGDSQSRSSLGQGTGSVTINSGGILAFENSSSAGSAAITNNSGGKLYFGSTSSGGSATITNTSGGILYFADTASGSSAVINNRGAINFSVGASAGSATIINSSGGTMYFGNSSSAGSATITNNSAGTVDFEEISTAGGATIANNEGTLRFSSTASAGNSTITNTGALSFNWKASAGNATITNNGGTIEFNGPTIPGYIGAATAGNATIINNTGGTITFTGYAFAQSATIVNNAALNFTDSSAAYSAVITNNALLGFYNNSTADNAMINNSGVLFMDTHNGGLTIGALSGNGNVFLGSNTLTVGGLNTSGTVGGVLSGAGGLIKVGSGTLTLTGENTYMGGTQIKAGTVAARGKGLGTGTVTIANGATLAVGAATNSNPLAQPTATLTLSSVVVTLGTTPAPLFTFNLGSSGISDTLLLTAATNPLTFSAGLGGSEYFVIGFSSATGSSLGAGTYTLFSFATPQAPSLLPTLDSYRSRPMGNLVSLTTDNRAFNYATDTNGRVTGLTVTIGGAGTASAPEPGALALIVCALPIVVPSGARRIRRWA